MSYKLGYGAFLPVIAKLWTNEYYSYVTVSPPVCKYAFLLPSYAYDPMHTVADILPHMDPNYPNGVFHEPFTTRLVQEISGLRADLNSIYSGNMPRPSVGSGSNISWIVMYDETNNYLLGIWWTGPTIKPSNGVVFGYGDYARDVEARVVDFGSHPLNGI